MGHYKSNLRDIEFNLFEVFHRQDILGRGPYEDLDRQTVHEILAQAAHLAENELADSLLDSDRHPPVYDPATYSVAMPESFRRSYRAFLDSELWRMDLPVSLDGIAVPPSLRWSVSELVQGANPAVHMFTAYFSFARILHELGTPGQQRLAALMAEKHWGATMVLTEPDAGSDVGAGRTRADQQPDGTWHITGVKRFITSAESDLQDNVVHFVLARPKGAGPGTKGLSLFIVPTFQVDLRTGELGARNGVFTTNLEHKMGLKVSTTCELTFGEVDGIPAVGTLLGEVHDGIVQMFRIIEFARMLVGTKAIATLSTGYLNALEYAKQRVQGPDLTRTADKSAPRVSIIHHPDVRRSLMLQKAYAEGLRALVLYTASKQDMVDIRRRDDLPIEAGSPEAVCAAVNDLLLPLVKGAGSERAWVLLGTESLQTLGGSGFLQDYPIEQYVRDAKIDTLYEGTTAIQGMDFFFRKILRDKGAALAQVAAEILETVKGDCGRGLLTVERELLGQALDDVQAVVGHLVTKAFHAQAGDAAAMYAVGQNTTRLLLACGDLVVGWLLLRQADVALGRLDEEDLPTGERRFYEGKVAGARFFARTVLPKLSAERSIALTTDNSLMEVDEAAF